MLTLGWGRGLACDTGVAPQIPGDSAACDTGVAPQIPQTVTSLGQQDQAEGGSPLVSISSHSSLDNGMSQEVGECLL